MHIPPNLELTPPKNWVSRSARWATVSFWLCAVCLYQRCCLAPIPIPKILNQCHESWSRLWTCILLLSLAHFILFTIYYSWSFSQTRGMIFHSLGLNLKELVTIQCITKYKLNKQWYHCRAWQRKVYDWIKIYWEMFF